VSTYATTREAIIARPANNRAHRASGLEAMAEQLTDNLLKKPPPRERGWNIIHLLSY
jgi:hypothetical protein